MGIYNTSCQCGLPYIDQNKYRFHFYLYVHSIHTYLRFEHHEINKSAIAKHCEENNQFKFNSCKIIYRPNIIFEIDFLEALHIRKITIVLLTMISPPPSLFSDYWKTCITPNFSWFFLQLQALQLYFASIFLLINLFNFL